MNELGYHSPTGMIHMVPMDEIAGFEVRPGIYELNGAMTIPCGVNFTIHSHGATSCELLLFHRMEYTPFAVLKFPEHYRIGNVYSMIVFKLNIQEFEYAYRLDGPHDVSKGILFDKNKILLDIYAKAVTGQSVWGTKNKEGSFYKARVVQSNFDWGKETPPLIPMEDLVIYELHVRGFTKHSSSGVSCPGTFAAIMEKIPYLKELGVNAVELMPIFEFDEMKDCREVDGKQVLDYWGYNTVSFFAPNTSYNSQPEYNREGNELKTLIKALHASGIECFLDVVFNHTAEGNEDGPFFSFKGFDNNIYYMLTPDGHYYNFSGCGNTLNCNHPMVQQMILDCLAHTAAKRITGSRDLYPLALRGNNASVNFLNCHDGFTLWDMYSYSRKHNEANGWGNQDGSDDNRSWNCGAEGDTDNKEILALRKKLAKNAVTALLMSRGTPMFLAGDEFLNTQYGNNNAYCQDNEISWLNWDFLQKNRPHFEYVKYLIQFRKEHDVIRKFSNLCSLGFREIEFFKPNEKTKVLCVMYAGRNKTDDADDIVLLALNVFWEEQECFLPALPYYLKWKIDADTAGRYLENSIPNPGESPLLLDASKVCMAPRSVLVFSASPQ